MHHPRIGDVRAEIECSEVRHSANEWHGSVSDQRFAQLKIFKLQQVTEILHPLVGNGGTVETKDLETGEAT